MLRTGGRLAFALCLAACSDAGPRALDGLDAAVETQSSPAVEPFDAASCDPLRFESTLDASAANVAAALDQNCFHSGAGRRELVIEALCAHEASCGLDRKGDCRVEYETEWRERQRPHGLSVPCADALLDSMSCLAQARCEAPQECEIASQRAETECDPNTPRGPACPPLPEDRELTKGPIPDDAINDAGMLDETRVPDFVPVWDQSGEKIAGYVRHCAIRTGGAIPVYAEDLKTVVGHMLPNRGFVPGPLP